MKIAVIGTGRMGTAIARALSPKHVLRLYDVDEKKSTALAAEMKTAFACTSPGEAVADADTIFLCVKPQNFTEALQSMHDAIIPDRHLVVSIAAGIPTATIEQGLPEGTRVIRLMPNTPLMVGCGATAAAAGRHADAKDLETVKGLLAPTGVVVTVPEECMDAVTGLSGSGPAYVYLMIEAMTEAGKEQGLPEAVAVELAVQTVIGAGTMVKRTGKTPSELIDMVTSPGGTTIEGLKVLRRMGFPAAVRGAVAAATRRSRELGGGAAQPRK